MERASVVGILFSRSVRSTFATFSLAPLDNEADQSPTLVRVQFFDQVKELRSYCRRMHKLGDKLEIRSGDWETIQDTAKTEWSQPRMVVNINGLDQAKERIQVQSSHHWTLKQCQEWQNRFFPSRKDRKQKPNPPICQPTNSNSTAPPALSNESAHHGGNKMKRIQAEHVARFLLSATMHKLDQSDSPIDTSQWSTAIEQNGLRQRAIEYLNSGSGVVDVAGGSGHVSMALGMLGVQSTVVDARPTVGKLPGRDRKIWNRAWKQSPEVVPFHTHRAWFGFRPNGVESSFRHPDQEVLPVCDENSDLLLNASAIVGLHPDEATGDIVHVAVRRRIPLVVVPCCVFARLFPQRRILSEGRAVSSYDDLLTYLSAQDDTIQQTKLPFDGKNTVLWTTF